MEARARQFAGDVSHELRTPLTAMTAVADILPGHPGLTGDAAAAAQLVSHRHLGAAIVIGAAAGLLPALRAARLSPTQALWSL